jgi:hypothetical protein
MIIQLRPQEGWFRSESSRMRAMGRVPWKDGSAVQQQEVIQVK